MEFCKSSKCGDEIVALYLAGSAARGDFVPGRSDIDIYVVVREDKEGIEEALKKAARRIASERLAGLFEIHREPLGISVATLTEAKTGKSFLGAGFEHQNFMRTGRLLFGREIRNLIPVSTREEERAAAELAVREICRLFREEFGELPTPTTKGLIYGLFSSVFRTACILCCGRGWYVSGKEEAVSAFRELFPDKRDLHDILSRCLELWQEWACRDLAEDEIKTLAGLCRSFLTEICRS